MNDAFRGFSIRFATGVVTTVLLYALIGDAQVWCVGVIALLIITASYLWHD